MEVGALDAVWGSTDLIRTFEQKYPEKVERAIVISPMLGSIVCFFRRTNQTRVLINYKGSLNTA